MRVGRDGEKVTLGSFLFRDDCHFLLLRLVMVSSSISRIRGVSPTAATGATSPASVEGNFVARDEQPAGNELPEPSESAPSTAISRALTVASRPCDNFESMVEAVLPCTTAQVLNESVSRMLGYHSRRLMLLYLFLLTSFSVVAIEFPCIQFPRNCCMPLSAAGTTL